jgi:hypothetical protein
MPRIEKANLLASIDGVGSSGPLEGLRRVHKAYLEALDRTAQGFGFGTITTRNVGASVQLKRWRRFVDNYLMNNYLLIGYLMVIATPLANASFFDGPGRPVAESDEYSSTGMFSTSDRIQIRKGPNLRGTCVDHYISTLTRNLDDYRGGGMRMADGQIFGTYHMPMSPLKKGYDLIISLDVDNKNPKRFKVRATTKRRANNNDVDYGTDFTAEIDDNLTKCAGTEKGDEGLLFKIVHRANRFFANLDSEISTTPSIRTVPVKPIVR